MIVVTVTDTNSEQTTAVVVPPHVLGMVLQAAEISLADATEEGTGYDEQTISASWKAVESLMKFHSRTR